LKFVERRERRAFTAWVSGKAAISAFMARRRLARREVAVIYVFFF